MEEENYTVLKLIIISLMSIIIFTCMLFFVAVVKVDALELTCGTRFTYGSDIVNGTPNSTNTTFGSTTIGNITQNGHYGNLNNIQYEAICTNGGNPIPAGTYSINLSGQITLNSTTNTMLKDMTWQSQFRNNATNTAITTSGKQFIIQTRYFENPNQSAYFFMMGDITLDSQISAIKIGFKTTFSLSSYGTYAIRLDQVNINGTGSGEQGIIDAIENNTTGMVNGFNDAIEGINGISTILSGQSGIINNIKGDTGAINGSMNQIKDKMDTITSLTSGIDNTIRTYTKMCDFITEEQNKTISENSAYLNSNGESIDNLNWQISDYIKISPEQKYIFAINDVLRTGQSYCIYNQNKELGSCYQYTNADNQTYLSHTYGYIRYSRPIEQTSTRYITLSGIYCPRKPKLEKPSIIEDYQNLENEGWENIEEINYINENIEVQKIEEDSPEETISSLINYIFNELLLVDERISLLLISILSLGIIGFLVNR